MKIDNEEAINMLYAMRADNLNLNDLYTKKKYEALTMGIKAIEILEDFEKAQIITDGRLNGRTYAYKCGLEDGKRKALEQEPSKTGHWIELDSDDPYRYMCSECHRRVDDKLALLEKTYADFCNCESREGWLRIDGIDYYTDVGYALEGMKIFMEVFKLRLAEREENKK